jgi:nucleoside-diphosphate-sugar epimerase
MPSNKVYITGYTGFVGKNLKKYFQTKGFEIIDINLRESNWSEKMLEAGEAVVHLAGKAHDLKNVSEPDEYNKINHLLTKEVYNAFLLSKSRVFIFLSSIKAVTDNPGDVLVTEETNAQPQTPYGKSKLLAENYLLQQTLPDEKKLYILRPCMIHGPGNKGNLNLLYKIVRKNLPYPLAAFDNKRSFLSIENLCFVINEMISREDISSGIYHISDDEPVSTNSVIEIMSNSLGKIAKLISIPKGIIRCIAAVGDRIPLPLNTERLKKLTSNYLVSNAKLKEALQKPLPISALDGLRITFESFNHVS